jgi:hypothetical protein
MRLIIAIAAAILVPACLIGAWYLYGQFVTFEPNDPYIWIRTRGFFLLCLVVTAAHVIFLGLPAYFLLRWRNAASLWSTLLCGFFLGALPVAIFSWPLRYPGLNSSVTINGVQTMINGVTTLDGWLQYLGGAAFFGAFGLASATVFWVIAGMSPNNSFKPNPHRCGA